MAPSESHGGFRQRTGRDYNIRGESWLPHCRETKTDMDPDKRQLRKFKRDIKRAGNKRRRQFLKRQLADSPEDAAHPEFEFGDHSSTGFNGMDQDATRRRKPGSGA